MHNYSKNYLINLSLIFMISSGIYSQDIRNIIKIDTIYIRIKDSSTVMTNRNIVHRDIYTKSETEFNHFYIYIYSEKYKYDHNNYKYFQLVNTKKQDLIKKISKHSLNLLDKKIVFDYAYFNKLGFHNSMDFLKDKFIYVIYKENKLFKCTRLYQAKIWNYSSLTN